MSGVPVPGEHFPVIVGDGVDMRAQSFSRWTVARCVA